MLRHYVNAEGNVPLYTRRQGRSQTFIPGGGQAVAKEGQAKFSKYFSFVENHLKLVLKF